MSETIRYTDTDLAQFKVHIEGKLEKGREYLLLITEQIKDLQENKDSEGDWMDDTSNATDLEMLFTMEARQKKHLYDLENALLRIRNKTYGICIVTGERIDKRRLMAVPTTSRSLEAKLTTAAPEKKARPSVHKKSGPNQIITKVIKKVQPITKTVSDPMADDFEFDADGDEKYDDLKSEVEGFDFEAIAEEE